ncbi:hypothetical protein A3K42_00795 [candidate division WWE3 bacterium RBG_13_37_7]|uniref:PilN domain-containing protein n=1 Tax=candidate division WWE3 bacterium RBG_13_37_7 TaxID=1802609 RepID=A0A1F4U0M9_UNCKA|nr:MAG: hypothetical protein A3K42_00795 [candidate division WWE3 bacterium RBG_13_37_7]
MAQSINLIPQQEMQKQIETKALNVSTIVSLVVLGIVVIASIYFLVVNGGKRNQIKTLDNNIAGLRSNVSSLSSIEIVARNLDKKYKVLNSIFKDRTYYSLLMQEINSRKPDTIKLIDLISREGGKMNISGRADNYIAVADFTNKLLDGNFGGGNPQLKDLFTEVTLNSVNLENQGGGVDFSIVIQFKQERLQKK